MDGKRWGDDSRAWSRHSLLSSIVNGGKDGIFRSRGARDC
jgi:hypothetical protein